MGDKSNGTKTMLLQLDDYIGDKSNGRNTMLLQMDNLLYFSTSLVSS
jgi:hypothetical protein